MNGVPSLLSKAAFLGGCLLPTVGALWLCLCGWEQSAVWRSRIEQATGRPVTLREVRTPTPRLVVLRDLTVGPTSYAPGTAFFSSLEIERTDRTIVVLSPSAHLQGIAIADWVTLAERCVLTESLASSSQPIDHWEVHLSTVTIVPTGPRVDDVGPRGRAGFTLSDVEISAQRTASDDVSSGEHVVTSIAPKIPALPAGADVSSVATAVLPSRVRIRFHAPGEPNAPRIELELARQTANGQAGHTVWRLDTHDGQVPADVFAYLTGTTCDGLEAATFDGRIWGVVGDGGQIELAGTWHGVDLAGLVTGSFNHKLTGLADLNFRSLQIKNGHLTNVSGTLEAHGGVIGESLLDAAVRELALTQTHPLPQKNWPYSHLAIAFRLDGEQLETRGLCEPGEALLTDANGPLLTATDRRGVKFSQFIRMLSPESDYVVPATEQTRKLVNVLPLPSIRPTETAELPRGTLRLR